MSRSHPSLKNSRINAFAVVPDAQPKLSMIILDLHFDTPGVGALEGVANRLARNAIDIVSQDWREVPWCTFHIHPKNGGLRVPLMCEFRAERADRPGKVIRNNSRRAKSLHRIATFGDCLFSLIYHALQCPLELRTIRELVRHGMKLQQHRFETLQQGVVSFTGDACALQKALFQSCFLRMLPVLDVEGSPVPI